MQNRKLGPFTVSEIGLGGMGLSHGYGDKPDRDTAKAVLNKALDLGVTLIDTAVIYGMGHNEMLVAEAIGHRRGEFTLATKGGIYTKDGQRELDASPARLRQSIDESLGRLKTEVIDLYYIHRPDPVVPIEDSVGELARQIDAGKIRSIGLSEMSAETVRRAHAVHPVAALQTEYSLWTRNPEIAVLDACAELGIAFVAFSPLARGFLSVRPPNNQAWEKGDLRAGMPRFQGDNYAANLKLLEPLGALAREAGCTITQLAIAWVLAQRPHIIALPGTGKLKHLVEDCEVSDLKLSPEVLKRASDIVNPNTVHGPRYNAATQADVTTEEFAS